MNTLRELIDEGLASPEWLPPYVQTGQGALWAYLVSAAVLLAVPVWRFGLSILGGDWQSLSKRELGLRLGWSPLLAFPLAWHPAGVTTFRGMGLADFALVGLEVALLMGILMGWPVPTRGGTGAPESPHASTPRDKVILILICLLAAVLGAGPMVLGAYLAGMVAYGMVGRRPPIGWGVLWAGFGLLAVGCLGAVLAGPYRHPYWTNVDGWQALILAPQVAVEGARRILWPWGSDPVIVVMQVPEDWVVVSIYWVITALWFRLAFRLRRRAPHLGAALCGFWIALLSAPLFAMTMREPVPPVMLLLALVFFWMAVLAGTMVLVRWAMARLKRLQWVPCGVVALMAVLCVAFTAETLRRAVGPWQSTEQRIESLPPGSLHGATERIRQIARQSGQGYLEASRLLAQWEAELGHWPEFRIVEAEVLLRAALHARTIGRALTKIREARRRIDALWDMYGEPTARPPLGWLRRPAWSLPERLQTLKAELSLLQGWAERQLADPETRADARPKR